MKRLIYTMLLVLLDMTLLCQQESLKLKKLTVLNDCKIGRNDYPPKKLLLISKKKNLEYRGVSLPNFCLSFTKTESNYFLYTSSDSGYYLISKTKGVFFSQPLFLFRDSKTLKNNLGVLKNQTYFLFNKETLMGDTMYVYKFNLNQSVVVNSHNPFWPISEIHVSEKKGIVKIAFGDSCLNFEYVNTR